MNTRMVSIADDMLGNPAALIDTVVWVNRTTP